jgi:hypothetical protein
LLRLGSGGYRKKKISGSKCDMVFIKRKQKGYEHLAITMVAASPFWNPITEFVTWASHVR